MTKHADDENPAAQEPNAYIEVVRHRGQPQTFTITVSRAAADDLPRRTGPARGIITGEVSRPTADGSPRRSGPVRRRRKGSA